MNNDIKKTLQSLESNNFKSIYANNKIAAKREIINLLSNGDIVGIGDSVTVRQIGIIEEFNKKGIICINPFSKEIANLIINGSINQNQVKKIFNFALMCDCFLTGTNAVTLDGKLVNIDGTGNRVAGMIFGPEKVIIVIGRNKIVKDVDEAFYRIKNVIAPAHGMTKERKVPCIKAGRCTDCNSRERLCNVSTIIEKNPTFSNISVLIIDDDLGLSWDESWPNERNENIYSNYAKHTWLKRASPESGLLG